MRIYIKYFLSFTTVIYTATLFAQQQAWHIQNYNSESGMQNSIKSLDIDRAGYLWMATETGLVKYDGNSFKLYDNANTPVIKNNRFTRTGLLNDSSIFAEDAEKNYYVFAGPGELKLVSYNSIIKKLPSSALNINIYDIYARCEAKYQQKIIPGSTLPDYRLINRSAANSMVYFQNKFFYLN